MAETWRTHVNQNLKIKVCATGKTAPDNMDLNVAVAPDAVMDPVDPVDPAAPASSSHMARCVAVLRSGKPCAYRAKCGGDVCGVHARIGKVPLEECSVCLDDVKPRQLKRLECGHVFHLRCVKRWFGRGALTCPMCRSPCLKEADVSRLSSRLGYLLQLNAAPVGVHFGVHIMKLLSNRDVQDTLRLTREVRQLLVELIYQSFSEAHFLHHLRRIGM